MPTAKKHGDPAPNFTLKDQSGEPHSLRDFGGRYVVLYFYPEDDSPSCTTQACEFRDHLPDFRGLKATVLGVSPDPSEAHAAFIRRHDLGFTLLSDTPGPDGVPRVAAAYGAWAQKTLFGRRYSGLVRTTCLIRPDGRVVARWDNVRVKGHASKVLEALKEHAGAGGRGKAKVRKGRRDSDPPYVPVRGPGLTRVRASARRRATVRRAAGRLNTARARW